VKAFRVTLRREDEDLAVALLWDTGTTGIEVIEDRSGSPTTLPEGQQIQLMAYVSDDRTVEAVEAALRPLCDVRVDAAAIPDVDWVARFRETFRAFEVGRFRVAPPWEPAPSTEPSRTLIVDPGRAFGTGTHETTRLCLLALQELADRRPLGAVVDIGAGTGILALAAARLGATRTWAVDLDPEATASARLHARLNNAPLLVVQADGGRAFRPGSFDVVVANLMAPLLLERQRELAELARAGGTLILSGLLDRDVPDVRRAYAVAGPTDVRIDGEWAALVVGIPA
jgi:ribosomal protein L11 methyltransferase